MTKPSGASTSDLGPAPKPARKKGEAIVGNLREPDGESPLGGREGGEASSPEDCTARDRAS
jgi:hypothetical protein